MRSSSPSNAFTRLLGATALICIPVSVSAELEQGRGGCGSSPAVVHDKSAASAPDLMIELHRFGMPVSPPAERKS